MEDDAGRGMDDDPVVDNGLSNDLVEAPKQCKLDIHTSVPKNLAFDTDYDEPKPNREPLMMDEEDSDDNRPPYKKELKLEKIR